jgi:hypothetical protein
MEKTTAFALAFLFFCLAGVTLLSQHDTNTKQAEKAQQTENEKQSKQIVNVLISNVEELHKEQQQIGSRFENLAIPTEEQIRMVAQAEASQKIRELEMNQKHYQSEAYCLWTPNPDGTFVLSCQKI